jgi:drug/metabolite transporter (DMT)-like permease
VPFTKLWLDDVPRLLASGWVYLSSGLGLSLWLLLAPRSRERSLSRADLPMLGLSILAGSIAAPLALFEGLARAPANLSSLLLNLEVVLTVVLAVALFGESLDRRRWVGTALVVLASAAIVFAPGGDGEGTVAGGLWIAAACLFWAVDNNVMRRIAAKDSLEIARWKGLVGGAVSMGVGLALGQALPARAEAWIGGAAIGVVSYGLSLALFIVGLRTLGAARTSALFGTHSFFGVVASAIVLREALTGRVLALAVVLALGVFLLLGRRPPDARGHAPDGVP